MLSLWKPSLVHVYPPHVVRDLAKGLLVLGLVTGCGETSDELVDDGPEPTGVRSTLALGFNHTCALNPDGGVECWGQVLSGNDGAPKVPTRFKGLAQSGWYSLDGGEFYACALSSHGSVWCWEYGSRPEELRELHGRVNQIAVGRLHACGLIRDGSVECWKSRGAPRAVTGIEGVVREISAGGGGPTGSSSWALTDAGTHFTWSSENQAVEDTFFDPILRLGKSEASVPCLVLTDATALCKTLLGVSGVVAASLAQKDGEGKHNACALLDGGSVSCRGVRFPQGDHLYTHPRGFTEVKLGNAHQCARSEDGVYCWGEGPGVFGEDIVVEEPTLMDL